MPDPRAQIRAARALVAGHTGHMSGPAPDPVPDPVPDPASALPDLLDRARAMVARSEVSATTMRSFHHFACTGGTLISRCIAAMPNTEILSEVDPLSRMGPAHPFVPTDMVRLARYGSHPPDQAGEAEIFLGGLEALARRARLRGAALVLRDHAHGQFCFDPALPGRATLREILAPRYHLRALVSVRHPMASFLSLRRQGWLHFQPATLQEYARRYLAFLDRHEGVGILRYEDFVADPDAGMARVCDALALGFNPRFRDVFAALHLSGASGRGGGIIAPRPARPAPAAIRAQAEASPAWTTLCARLGYDPASG